ncbi:ABC transporter substrate-binding protein [Amycolatopsis sp. NPDC051372]|uniref:ABC transporter substrate-binding protein n=1 Tax=Amycolatopsis sp. NPDC051372 TaxID=3155669 RepID=UPI00344827A4
MVIINVIRPKGGTVHLGFRSGGRKGRMAAVLSLSLGVVLTGSACSGGVGGDSSGDSIKVGAIFALSGVYGAVGSEMLDGVRFAVDEANAAGGIGGRKVDLDVKDYRSDPSLLTGLANELLQDGAVAVVGPETSTSAVVLDPTMASAKVPIITAAGLVPKGEYSFSVQPLSGYFDLAAEYAKSRGAKALCDLGVSGASFESLQKVLEPAAAKAGLPMGTRIPFDAAATSLTPQMTQLKSDGCTAIFAGGTGPSVLVVARAMVDLGMTDTILMTQPTNATSATINQLGQAAPFTNFGLPKVMVADLISADDPAMAAIKPFAASWKRAGKPALTTNNAMGYSSVQIVDQAIEKGGPTSDAIYSYLKSGKDFQTPMMTYNFGSSRNGTLPDRGDGWFSFARWNPATKAFELTFDPAKAPAGR